MLFSKKKKKKKDYLNKFLAKNQYDYMNLQKLFQDTIITGQRTKFVDCEPLAVVDDTKDNEQWKVFQNKMLENA